LNRRKQRQHHKCLDQHVAPVDACACKFFHILDKVVCAQLIERTLHDGFGIDVFGQLDLRCDDTSDILDGVFAVAKAPHGARQRIETARRIIGRIIDESFLANHLLDQSVCAGLRIHLQRPFVMG
jgi:hypothetical protein